MGWTFSVPEHNRLSCQHISPGPHDHCGSRCDRRLWEAGHLCLPSVTAGCHVQRRQLETFIPDPGAVEQSTVAGHPQRFSGRFKNPSVARKGSNARESSEPEAEHAGTDENIAVPGFLLILSLDRNL